MMNLEQRLQILIGQLHFQIAALQAELEALRAKMAEQEAEDEAK